MVDRRLKIYPDGDAPVATPCEKKTADRKFKLTLLGLGLITGVGFTALFFPETGSLYVSFLGGVLGILGLYFGANVTSGHLNKKKEKD